MTGHDLSGNRLPLFFHLTDDAATRWYQPVLFYLSALVLMFLPLTETSIRIPTVMIGALDVLLIYGVSRRLFHSTWVAVAAGLLLALSPAHLIFSRQALDYICPLPFVLGWIWLLAICLDTGNVLAAFGAGLVLGVGFYSYLASWVMMPTYLCLTWVAVRASKRSRRLSIAATVGMALPLFLLVPWLWLHPDMLRDTVGRYNLYDTRHLSPLQGVKEFLNYNNIQERMSVYWDYFNPAFLFFSGGSNLTTSTRRAGVFVLPVAPFLICGLGELWQHRRLPISLVLVAGFLLAPLPATLVDERYAVQRELFILPFGVLIGAFGIVSLCRRPGMARIAATLLLAALPIQFLFFYRDYFSDYQIRSASWFDPINFRGVAEYLISSDSTTGVPGVYLSQDLDDGAARWRFYLAKHSREDLLSRTRYFRAADLNVSAVPAGSLLVLYANDPKLPDLLARDQCSLATTVIDAAGGKAAVILRKAS